MCTKVKNIKGITLIALIITIIVLLILARNQYEHANAVTMEYFLKHQLQKKKLNKLTI